MNNEPRKATDVIISLENKINQLMSLVKILEFDVKNLSNKLLDTQTRLYLLHGDLHHENILYSSNAFTLSISVIIIISKLKLGIQKFFLW